MKRLRSIEVLDSYGDKCKDPNPNPNWSSSSSHRSFYYKPDSVRKGMARYDRDRSADEDREGSRMMRKRSDHDSEGGFDRRKGGFDRYSGENRGGGAVGGGYDRTLMHRSESFCGGLSSTRREFPLTWVGSAFDVGGFGGGFGFLVQRGWVSRTDRPPLGSSSSTFWFNRERERGEADRHSEEENS
ncbi:hypothetical protein I3842_09G107100 [Carya illinoinensis]|uniref:Uncharacterized protein n=1 Tax=Carya illinoinensis TaxID=32201 RepID=A0A922E2Q1_CARIL|nr:hypothetical protein I3842_09G107100 [Carya illinoinensis]